ncbi:DUF6446 family protein [Paenirhodobacter sp.]|uniref:DUF6446 family protein n=1 Tax=Paenirhodobacter sp. TaxID=1965326 RepID=UPI003B426376
MNGRLVGGEIVVAAVIAGAGVWYAQVYGYYHDVPADSTAAEIRLTAQGGAEEPVATSNFKGIDGDSSPLKFRACFTADLPAATADAYQRYERPTPLNAPKWFSCFDARQIGEDLQAGRAKAYLSELNIHPGVDRVVAIYPDGRAYAWQQLNDKAGE